MKYDFETYYDRNGTGAISVDLVGNPGVPGKPKDGFSKIPMWIADMNFATYPGIQKRMIDRINHPLFGYFFDQDNYFDAIIDWHKKRNGVTNLKAGNITYHNGVLGGVVSALRVLTSSGDNVLVNSPTYIGFTNTLKNNGFNIVNSSLVEDKDGVYRLDFSDMEKKVKENNIHVYIFCSPHNPAGRVWTKDELKELSDFCERNGLYVISDEIWSDIILNGNTHIPTQSGSNYLREHTIAMYAPSKTFNIAGLVGAYSIIYNKYLLSRVEKEMSLSHYNMENILSNEALISAYTDEGYLWVSDLKEVLSKNTEYAYNYFKNIPGVKLPKPEGTYMLFIDFTDYLKNRNLTIDELLKLGWDCGVLWQDGRPFNGENSVRMNVALPYAKLVEAFDRLTNYVFK